MDSIILKILELVVIIVVALITRYVIPLIKTKVQTSQLSVIAAWAITFVRAAEQIFIGKNKGDEKLIAVTEWLTNKANELGIKLNEEQIRALIEEAVNTYNEEKNK